METSMIHHSSWFRRGLAIGMALTGAILTPQFIASLTWVFDSQGLHSWNGLEGPFVPFTPIGCYFLLPVLIVSGYVMWRIPRSFIGLLTGSLAAFIVWLFWMALFTPRNISLEQQAGYALETAAAILPIVTVLLCIFEALPYAVAEGRYLLRKMRGNDL